MYSDPFIVVLFAVVGVIYFRSGLSAKFSEMSQDIFASRRLQDFYRVSSRELKRLDSAQRSPMVALYLECVSNAVTLRSLGAPCLQTYRKKMHELLDRMLQVSMSVQLASQVHKCF